MRVCVASIILLKDAAMRDDAQTSPPFRLPEPAARRAGVAKRRGRPRGSGYQHVDAPLLEEMHRLLEARLEPTAEAAAKAVAGRAYGGGMWRSKVDRLAKGYRRQFYSATLG